MRWSIWYHLHNLKDVENAHRRVLLLVKLQVHATLLEVTLLHGRLSRFLNCKNDTKSRKTSHKF